MKDPDPELPPLDDDIRALLDRAAGIDGPPAGVKARVRTHIGAGAAAIVPWQVDDPRRRQLRAPFRCRGAWRRNRHQLVIGSGVGFSPGCASAQGHQGPAHPPPPPPPARVVPPPTPAETPPPFARQRCAGRTRVPGGAADAFCTAGPAARGAGELDRPRTLAAWTRRARRWSAGTRPPR